MNCIFPRTFEIIPLKKLFFFVGGNGAKSAKAREKANKEANKGGNAGGGKSGMEARKGGNMAEAMAAAQAERERVQKAREEKAAKK